jgi:outer membrane protein TolC
MTQPIRPIRMRARLPLLLLGTTVLAGCASFSQDGGFDKLASITRERQGIVPQAIKTEQDGANAGAEVKRLLGRPLDAEGAVKVALLNNRSLQASLADLGIAEADLVQAGRLHNPGFTFARLEGGGEREFERKFLFDLMGLLTLSTRSEIEQRRFQATQLRVAEEVLRLAQMVRQDWFKAVAAHQAAKYQEDVLAAAEAGAALAKRMAEAGNFSRQRQQREQLFQAETRAELTRARLAESAARERLARVLGLSGAQRGFTLPDRLPDLPASLMEEKTVLQRAMDGRLDLDVAKRELEGLAKSLGLVKATRLVNVLEVSYLNNNVAGQPHARGYEIELSLPLFDWGGARAAKAEALYTQAMHRVAELAVNAESEVRDAYAGYRAAHELAASYRDEIVPLRKSLSEEALLRYNGMLIGVWDLLADTRAQVAAVNAAIQAQRDFWVAESNLQIALNGRGAGATSVSNNTPAAEAAGGH